LLRNLYAFSNITHPVQYTDISSTV
jgi:hypothetical protein